MLALFVKILHLFHYMFVKHADSVIASTQPFVPCFLDYNDKRNSVTILGFMTLLMTIPIYHQNRQLTLSSDLVMTDHWLRVVTNGY